MTVSKLPQPSTQHAWRRLASILAPMITSVLCASLATRSDVERGSSARSSSVVASLDPLWLVVEIHFASIQSLSEAQTLASVAVAAFWPSEGYWKTS